MEYVVITYLYLAILLYIVLGGADFGAGIIEIFTSERNISRTQRTLYQAIGPIWEANHMWLIIAVVILFVAYPIVYSTLSVYLHIPLLIMLMGIIARGTAFVFRHYDAVHDDLQNLYNKVFRLSSFVTPFFLGVIAGSTVSGHINVDAESFLDAYVFSWLNPFSMTVGLFTVVLCGYLASVYLIGEAKNTEDRSRFIRKAKRMNVSAVIIGACVFVVAVLDDIPLLQWVFADAVGITAVIGATISLFAMWKTMGKVPIMMTRAMAGFQVTMILLAISYAHFPDFVILRGGSNLSLLKNTAPESTINALGWALLIGSIFILPALFYLYYSFQKKSERA